MSRCGIGLQWRFNDATHELDQKNLYSEKAVYNLQKFEKCDKLDCVILTNTARVSLCLGIYCPSSAAGWDCQQFSLGSWIR